MGDLSPVFVCVFFVYFFSVPYLLTVEIDNENYETEMTAAL